MKYVLLAMILVVCLPRAEAKEDVYRIEIGRSSGGSDSDLRLRVVQLERAVDQLQRKVFDLESGGGSKSSWTTCFIKTPFNGTFSATSPTETAAKAEALEKCSAKTDSSMYCSESYLKCGK
jgi:hypothetical protein